MKCLNACQLALLELCMGQGDAGVPLYRFAEEMAPKYDAGQTADACDCLLHLGLLKNIGTTTKVVKLSSCAVGDARAGFFTTFGESPAMLKLQKQLVELEAKHDEAVWKAAMLAKSGGLVDEK